jgi:Fic family protein
VLRYKEKEDIESRFSEVDWAVEQWRERSKSVAQALRDEFLARLKISLIYHDAALEGEVLSYSEIKAAIDPTIISDTSLIPSYEDIKRYNDALDFAAEFAATSRKVLRLETIKRMYEILSAEDCKGTSYRKENPLHRLYYHDIAQPEKIGYQMRKFGQWLIDQGKDVGVHAVERAARTHHTLMAIFPWTKQTGRIARIVSNLLLMQAEYPLAVIHSIDRQRYYEALRTGPKDLISVYLEAVETTALSELRVYDEAERAPRRRKRA